MDSSFETKQQHMQEKQSFTAEIAENAEHPIVSSFFQNEAYEFDLFYYPTTQQ
jgi:hypothetical protein